MNWRIDLKNGKASSPLRSAIDARPFECVPARLAAGNTNSNIGCVIKMAHTTGCSPGLRSSQAPPGSYILTLGKTGNCQREGSKGWLESRFWATRVQPSHRYQDGRPPGKEVWLLAEWPESAKSPTKYCLCDLPTDYSLRRIVRLVKCRWKIEQDYHQLKEELGLDYYEGRNWQGWHHHVTMVMVAHAFLTLETLRSKKNFWVDPPENAT
jgi:hypothetical protein